MKLFKWRWLKYDFIGFAVAVMFAGISFTPSLLPRPPLLQGVIAGLAAVSGYIFGCLLTWLLRHLISWRPSAKTVKYAWFVLLGATVVTAAVMLPLGNHWQNQLHESMGLDAPPVVASPGIFIITAIIFIGFIALGRGIRALARLIAKPVRRVVPQRIVRPVSAVLAIFLLYTAIDGVLFRYINEGVNSTFSLSDGGTDDGSTQPEAAERSGSPGSLNTWESLGRTGRNFVAQGPTVEELSDFSGAPAQLPIRAYAGLESANSTRARAESAVQDMEQAGGFQREAIVVNTTTGTGWINESSAAAVEYLFNGDVAQVGIQYSYLPSWISYLGDQDKAQKAGRELFEAVYDVWAELDEDNRPELYVFGESLGSYGSESAFSGIHDLVNRTDGAVWVGPTSFNELHERLVDERDAGSPAWLPIVDGGETVRFVTSPEQLVRPNPVWEHPRVVYLQHPSDPIVWWTPDLFFSKPDWLREDAAQGVSEMTWIPGVTFWQLAADLPFAIDVPDGYGHNYAIDLADMWVAVADPDDWSQTDTERLREAVDGLVRPD